MTKEEILAMEAGSKLDAEIENKLFDHKVEWRLCWGEPECGMWEEIESSTSKDMIIKGHEGWGEDLIKKLPCYCENREFDMWDIVPFYSTDISAAWRVVEKFREAGKIVLLQSLGDDWYCMIADTYARVKAAPEAICKAALLAKLAI